MVSWRHKLRCSLDKAMAFPELRDDETVGGTGAVLITEHVIGVAGNRLGEVSDIAIAKHLYPCR